jgi:hypothetical protein
MKNFSKIISSLMLMALVALAVSLFAGPRAFLPVVGILFLAGFVKGLVKFEYHLITGALFDGFVMNDTTYAGEAASSFIVKAITGNDTVQGGHVYIKDGIKNQFTIPRWDADFEDFVQDRTATPTSKGTMTVDGQKLTPQDYMIYTEFNPRDYESHWFATTLNATLIDRALPITVESVVVQEVLKRHDKWVNKALWNSNKTTPPGPTYKYFDGFLKKGSGAPAANKIAAVGGGLTAANIQAEFLKGYKALPASLRYDPEMKYFCSYATYDLYGDSQVNQPNKGVDITQDAVRKFKGRPVVPIADFPDNTYVIARGKPTPESNLWVGMNSTDDAKLEVRQLQANSELWFVKMLMKLDVQYGWLEEIIYYA